jgi:hypothetical protein
MKSAYKLLLALTVSQLMAGCREIDVARTTYQQIAIYDFSELRAFTFDATNDSFISSYKLTVNGDISHDVVLTINRLDQNKNWVPVQSIEPIRLRAGTYTNKGFEGDYYSNDLLQLVVTSSAATTGNLAIEWGVN